MADFRKWLVAFALIATLLGLATTASANGVALQSPLTCSADTSTNRDVRGEGVTELVGDIVLTCNGGSPTPAGQPVPLINVHVQLQVPITSRTFGTYKAPNATVQTVSEAMLTIDEPFPSVPFPSGTLPIPGSPTAQYGCIAAGGETGGVGVCDDLGDGTGTTTYTDDNPYQDHPFNTFQGVATSNLTTGKATVDFLGVPVDPPGTNNSRIIRITNIRGDMTGLLNGATNAPTGVPVFVSISFPSTSGVSLSTPTLQVGAVYQGLQSGAVTNATYNQCVEPSGSPSITFAEGFASAFKTKQVTDNDENEGGSLQSIRDAFDDQNWEPQNIAFQENYLTETGFTPDDIEGALQGGSTTAADDTIGVADYGTRFLISVQNLQNGVTLSWPGEVDGTSNNSPDLVLWTVTNANADGTGSAADGNDVDMVGSWTPTSGATNNFVVYEVMGDNPNLPESITISPGVSYVINLPKNEPALGNPGPSQPSIATATVSFAPLAADLPGTPLPTNGGKTNTTSRGSLPRFINTQASPADFVTIDPCSCNLLFPWVVSGGGLETGIAVVNTSWSPTIWNPGSKPESGTITLWFYGTRAGSAVQGEFHPNGSATPAEPAIVVPGGCAFALYTASGSAVNCVPVPSGNGSISSGVTEGFVGYVIATTTFQYCHGVAYVALANSLQGSYYEAIELDEPFALQHIHGAHPTNQRTGQWGESQAH